MDLETVHRTNRTAIRGTVNQKHFGKTSCLPAGTNSKYFEGKDTFSRVHNDHMLDLLTPCGASHALRHYSKGTHSGYSIGQLQFSGVQHTNQIKDVLLKRIISEIFHGKLGPKIPKVAVTDTIPDVKSSAPRNPSSASTHKRARMGSFMWSRS